MRKEKNNVFDTNITIYELLKFLSETKTEGYEIGNVVSETGDSIYTESSSVNELADSRIVVDEGEGGGGKVFISVDRIGDFINQLIIDQKRLGPSLNNNKNGN